MSMHSHRLIMFEAAGLGPRRICAASRAEHVPKIIRVVLSGYMHEPGSRLAEPLLEYSARDRRVS